MLSLAFVFPGQGSQTVGMLKDLNTHYNVIQKTFTEATEVLGYDAWQLAQAGPKEQLDNTLYTQPLLLTASVALWRLWRQELGLNPKVCAGHSLGEYSALVAADALQFRDALYLVQARAQCMVDAVPPGVGAMAAVLGLADEAVQSACTEAEEGQIVAAVNYNSPGQVVIAGHKEAVARAKLKVKALGAKRALDLPVSVPSHCELMKPAALAYAKHLNAVPIKNPQIPILHNVDADFHPHPDDIRTTLSEQLYQPVQWSNTVHHMAVDKISHCLECGPGKVLSGLVKRIEPNIKTAALHEPEAFVNALQLR